MEAMKSMVGVIKSEVELLKRLVAAELDRQCADIDELIQRVYEVVPAKHTEQAIVEVKAAVLELVKSPLADLERKLAAIEVEPEEKPAEEVKPEEEAAPAEDPKVEEEPRGSKA